MKNREKYKNELIEVIKKDGKLCEFVKKHDVFRMFGMDSISYCKMTCVTCGTALKLWLDEEYEEPKVDWNKVPVDTLVRVRDNYNSGNCLLRYFKGFDETLAMRKYVVWSDGATSKTAGNNTENWMYCELVEDGDEVEDEDE